MTPPLVFVFLLFLFKENQFSFYTIEGCRSVIAASVNFIAPFDNWQRPVLSTLVYSSQEATACSSRGTELVLWSFSSCRFEPLAVSEEVPLKELTLKQCFHTVGLGSRRSEVYSSSYSKFGHLNWTKVFPFSSGWVHSSVLSYVHSSCSCALPCPFPLFQGDMVEERSFCPVRAWKIYLSRTQYLRLGKVRLFISFKEGHLGDIHKFTILAGSGNYSFLLCDSRSFFSQSGGHQFPYHLRLW